MVVLVEMVEMGIRLGQKVLVEVVEVVEVVEQLYWFMPN